MNKLIVFTDGGARGNPGPAGIGVIVKTESGKTIQKISQKIGETTNNVAEYTAVIKALEWMRANATILQLNNFTINFFLDSTLVVNQLNGLFKVKDAKLRELLLKVRILEQEVGGKIYYSSIPREKNMEADALVNQALDS
ncbi:ribonuclease HI family protein [Patescibacteria group bacterium]|nr:ribonuclease HI family protein [Patescibacteria group bacterium]